MSEPVAATVPLSHLFEIGSGHQLALNSLLEVPSGDGIAFVSRTHRNNGIAAWVEPIDGVEAAAAGTISVCLRSRNHALASFVQPRRYYTAYHVAVLTPKAPMTLREKLWYCKSIEAHRFRFGFGRQANRTLGDLLVVKDIPDWVADARLPEKRTRHTQVQQFRLDTSGWQEFRFQDLFDMVSGQFVKRRDLPQGDTPFVTASDVNNGVSAFVDLTPDWPGGQLTVANNGSVGAAFYQGRPFVASRDVTVLDPGFEMSAAVGLFICAVIRLEAFRYNYARKWNTNRMKVSPLRLPTLNGKVDVDWIEQFMREGSLGWVLPAPVA